MAIGWAYMIPQKSYKIKEMVSWSFSHFFDVSFVNACSRNKIDEISQELNKKFFRYLLTFCALYTKVESSNANSTDVQFGKREVLRSLYLNSMYDGTNLISVCIKVNCANGVKTRVVD